MFYNDHRDDTVQFWTILYRSGQSGRGGSAILDRLEEETMQWKRRQSCSEQDEGGDSSSG
jgi:hypothetical protein